MLAAINPLNKELFTDAYPICHSQGELLYLIEKNSIKEVFLDPQLPGHLSTDALVAILQRKFPGIEVSIIESHQEPVIATKKIIDEKFTIVSVVVFLTIQSVFNLAVQYSTMNPRQIIYVSLASISAFIFFLGGFSWLKTLYTTLNQP